MVIVDALLPPGLGKHVQGPVGLSAYIPRTHRGTIPRRALPAQSGRVRLSATPPLEI